MFQVGAYRVLKQIGEGGMGTVWLAEHSMLGRRAAIKMLHPMYASQPEIVTRFFNEARAATAISDPGIVQVFDFGHHDGTAYIVMELLEGETVDRRLRRIGRFPPSDALRIMRQVASSLAAAHARGIVHRDLKPENIFIVGDPEVPGGERAKIVDFGIAKLTNDPTRTSTSAVMGTPTYMSPEQCRGAGLVDARSDVYALGCVLFALLTGRPPFEAQGAGEIIAMHLRETPPPPSSRNPAIPPELDFLVLTCLAKDPAQRFATARELATAIDAALAGSAGRWGAPQNASPNSHVAFAAGPPSQPAFSVPTTLSSAAAIAVPATQASPKRRAWISSLVAGGLVATAAIVWGATRSPSESPTEKADETTPEKPAAAPVESADPAPAKSRPDTKTAVPKAPDPASPALAIVPAPAPPAPAAQVAPKMVELLRAFARWAQTHPGAECPTPDRIGAATMDPWGHPFQLTCTDQPANQIIGLVSGGPDAAIGTNDDIASWQLDHRVTDLVRGPRWVAKPVAATGLRRPSNKPPTTPPATTMPPPPPVSKPPPAIQLDEHGIPTQR